MTRRLDALAKEAAVSHAGALKLTGSVLFGIGLLSFVPDVAGARRRIIGVTCGRSAVVRPV